MIQTTTANEKTFNDGIIVIDKPEGCSSAKAVAKLKKVPWIKKTGHTGTLDPFATGIMICGINKGTRLSRFFLNGNKTYQAELILGTETDTQDATGTVLYEHPESLETYSTEHIVSTIKNFEGHQKQLPPVYSALKQNGVPLYKLAREGKPVQKPAREITIYSIRIIKINTPSIWLEISCSAGTYIRTLCNDIGKKLGCGGHLKSLRRTESCGFNLENAVPLNKVDELDNIGILKTKVISMSRALKNMPQYVVEDEIAEKIRNGKPLYKKDYNFLFKKTYEKHIKIVNEQDKLLAILSNNSESCEYRYCCVFNN